MKNTVLAVLLAISLAAIQGCSTSEASLEAPGSVTKTKVSTSKATGVSKSGAGEFDAEFASEDDSGSKFDPLSGYNRFMTGFNDFFFMYILNPISKVYAAIIPKPVRYGLRNFVKNINFPIRFANNLLQGKIKNSLDETGRFIVNSTFGVAGLFDIATNHLNIPLHDEDFGQTLGFYGIGPGFHIVLPFFGPSNLRDTVSLFTADAFLSPLIYFKELEDYRLVRGLDESAVIIAGHMINKNSLEHEKYESLREDAIDLYTFLRDAYEEKRESEIAE